MKSLTISNTHAYIEIHRETQNTEISDFYFYFHSQILVTPWSWWNLNVCCINAFATKCSNSITKFFWSSLSFLTFCVFLLDIVHEIHPVSFDFWLTVKSAIYVLPDWGLLNLIFVWCRLGSAEFLLLHGVSCQVSQA